MVRCKSNGSPTIRAALTRGSAASPRPRVPANRQEIRVRRPKADSSRPLRAYRALLVVDNIRHVSRNREDARHRLASCLLRRLILIREENTAKPENRQYNENEGGHLRQMRLAHRLWKQPGPQARPVKDRIARRS